jgi:hypothetical protein
VHSQPLVSCIMPTYNRWAFVPQAIVYFLRQDYPKKGPIVMDDGTEPIQALVTSNMSPYLWRKCWDSRSYQLTLANAMVSESVKAASDGAANPAAVKVSVITRCISSVKSVFTLSSSGAHVGALYKKISHKLYEVKV